MNLNFSLLALVLRSEGDCKTAKLKTTSHPEKEIGFVTQMPSDLVNDAFLLMLLMSMGIQDMGIGNQVCSQHTSVWLWATCFHHCSSCIRNKVLYTYKYHVCQPLVVVWAGLATAKFKCAVTARNTSRN